MGDGERSLAFEVLAYRLQRKCPKAKAPTWFDEADVARVAQCAASLDGDADAKCAGLLAAVDGAFCVSKEGAPTVRFIFGKLEHFHAHVERGEKKRRNDALNAEHKAKEAVELAARSAEADGSPSTAKAPPEAAQQTLQATESEEGSGGPTLVAPPAERGVEREHEAPAFRASLLGAVASPELDDEARQEAELRAAGRDAERERRHERETEAQRARQAQQHAARRLIAAELAAAARPDARAPAVPESDHRAAVRAEMEAMLAKITDPQLRARLCEQLERSR